jgi:hypothetical protein
VQAREGNSPDWIQIGEAYSEKPLSIRALAKHHGISDAAVRKAAKKFAWVKADANLTSCEPACEPEPKPVGTRIDRATKALPAGGPVTPFAAGRWSGAPQEKRAHRCGGGGLLNLMNPAVSACDMHQTREPGKR